VRLRVAIDFQSFGIVLGQQAELDVVFDGASQIDQLGLGAVGAGLDLCDEGGVGQARADAAGDVESGSSFGYVFDATVGQLYVDEFGHDLFTCHCALGMAPVTNDETSILVVITGL